MEESLEKIVITTYRVPFALSEQCKAKAKKDRRPMGKVLEHLLCLYALNYIDFRDYEDFGELMYKVFAKSSSKRRAEVSAKNS